MDYFIIHKTDSFKSQAIFGKTGKNIAFFASSFQDEDIQDFHIFPKNTDIESFETRRFHNDIAKKVYNFLLAYQK